MNIRKWRHSTTISRTRNPASDGEWSYGEKRAVVYFLLYYLETSRKVFDNAFMPLKLKATTSIYKDNLQKGSGTDVELIFPDKNHNFICEFRRIKYIYLHTYIAISNNYTK